MPAGEARRLTYKPGMERPRDTPMEPGTYQFTLKDYGKPGIKGWKPGNPPNKKFPFRMIRWEAVGVEDESTGNPKSVRDVASASPKAFFRIFDIAAAAGYEEEIDLEEAPSPTSPLTRKACEAIDKLLAYIKDNGIVMTGVVAEEEYKGRPQARIVEWQPPAAEGSEDEETTDEDTSEDEEEVAEEDEEVDSDETVDEDEPEEDTVDEDEEVVEDEEEVEEEEERHVAKKAVAKKKAAAPLKVVKGGKKKSKK